MIACRGSAHRPRALVLAFALTLTAFAAPQAGLAQPPRAADLQPAIAAARAATERRDWNDALPRWRALEAAAPADVDLLIESARVHGFADRNADAAELYRRAIALAPERRGDVLLSLAWQTLWAGLPLDAEPLFLEVAARPGAVAGGGDGFDAWVGAAQARRNADRLADSLAALEQAQRLRPADRGTRREIAQTLAWLGRTREATAAFERLVAEDPNDRRSAYGLARLRNEAGLHRAAAADYRRTMQSERAAGAVPAADVRFDYARALRWAGYDDHAHRALDGLVDPDARWLRDFRTGREQRHWVDGGVDYATDSDDLDTTIVAGAFGWRVDADNSVEIGARRVDLKDPALRVDGERLGIAWRRRWGTAEETVGAPGDRGPAWITVAVQANRYDDWRPVTGAVRAHWLPGDRLRVEGEAGREVVEIPAAIANRITVDVYTVGGRWRLDPRSTVAAAASALDYSDGNLRARFNLRADHTLPIRPRVTVGVEGMAFRSSDPTSDVRPGLGYWNPRAYREARGFVVVNHEARAWDFSLKLGLGTAREEDGWGNTSRARPNVVELAAAYDVDRSFRLRAYAGGSGGAMGVASGGDGYWRRYGGIAATGWF